MKTISQIVNLFPDTPATLLSSAMAEEGEPEGEYAAKVSLADQTILMGATLSMDRLVGRMEKQVARTVVTHQLQHGDMDHFRDIAVR